MSDELKSTIEAGLAAVKSQLDEKLAAHTADVEKYGKSTTELTGKIDTLSEQYKAMKEQLIEVAQNTAKAPSEAVKAGTLGQQFVQSEAYKSLSGGMSRNSNSQKITAEVKYTVIESGLGAVLSDGNSVLNVQRPGVVGGDFAPVSIRDVITTIPLSAGNMIEGLRESNWENNAAEVEQGALKPESIIEFAPYDVAIRNVAHWIKVSKHLIADAPAIRQYIDVRLRDGLRQRIDRQLIVGNGVNPNLSGLLDAGNYTAFTPTSGANLVESINVAKYQMMAATGLLPTAVVVNPADWSAMELAREGAGTGAYLYGAPGTVAGGMPFGVRVVLNNNVPAGTFIIGNFDQGATIFQREDAVVEMGYVNDDFTRNLITIRAEERLALSVERPSLIYAGDITSS